jgi:Transglutaminase-like superfamily
MEIWRRFWRLSGFERLAVIEAAAALSLTWLGLRIAGFRRWKAIAERHTLRSEPKSAWNRDAKVQMGKEVARMAAAAARYLPFRTNCLEQSFVLCWLLERRGIAADLKMGARKVADRFEAHAWVENEGVVVGGLSEEHLHFVPFEGSVASIGTEPH